MDQTFPIGKNNGNMHMMINNKIFSIIFIVLFLGCTNGNMEIKKGLEIYCLDRIKDGTVASIDKIKLPKNPIISFSDIQYYDWSNHEIFLTEESWKKIKKRISLKILGTNGLPFVLTIDRKPIYIGYFWSLLYSIKPKTPVVLLENINKGRFIISPEEFKNIITNSELYNFLLKSKMIKNN